MLSAIAHFDAATATTPASRRRPSERRFSSRNLESSHSNNLQAHNHNGNEGGPPRLNLLLLELHRLLHCMERDHHTANDSADTDTQTTTTNSSNNNISWQALGTRMELLQSLWQQVQHALFEAKQQQQQQQQQNNNTHGYYEEEGEPPTWYRDYEQRVYRASQKAQEAIHALQRQEAAEAAENAELAILEQDDEEEEGTTSALFASHIDLIGQVFFPQEEQPQEQQYETEEEEEAMLVEHDLIGEPMAAQPQDEEEDFGGSTRQTSHQPARNNNNNVDIQAFQKEQREQIEQAIALMAAQLKQETENIHSTLKGQTDGLLDEMEDIAARNVEDVTKVTEDVTTHVSDGWKRSFGTITLLILVASLFLFSLVTIYMIPKYNSPPSAVPPQKICRMVNGKEECLDLNAWLTGSSNQKEPNNQEEEETSAPYFTTLEDSPPPKETHPKSSQEHRQAGECEMGMDGRCIHHAPVEDHHLSEEILQRQREMEKMLKQEQLPEDHHLSEEILDRQREMEKMLEQERLATEQQKRQQGSTEDLSEEVLALLALDLGAEGPSIGDLSDDEIARMKMELEAQGKLEENLARAQHDEEAEVPGDQPVQEDLQQFPDDAGESEFDVALRREQLLQEREQRENLHNIRQAQGQGSSEQHLLEERERMKLEYEEQMKRRDEFREQELLQLEEQRRQRELLEERQRQEALEREQQAEQERQQQQIQEDEFIDLPPPPPSESFAQQLKGFEAFRDEQEAYKPPAKAQPVAGAGAAMGFGAFGGSAGAAEVDPFGGQKAGANAEGNAAPAKDPPEPEFRGRPFAPRDIRRAAASDENDLLRDYIDQRPNWVNRADKNNWGAIHLAVRAGHYESVEILVNANADINSRTKQGLTPLGMALERLGEGHPIANLLRQHGGEI